MHYFPACLDCPCSLTVGERAVFAGKPSFHGKSTTSNSFRLFLSTSISTLCLSATPMLERTSMSSKYGIWVGFFRRNVPTRVFWQVTLYADYDYSNLMPFLKQSNYYPLEKALQICEEVGDAVGSSVICSYQQCAVVQITLPSANFTPRWYSFLDVWETTLRH